MSYTPSDYVPIKRHFTIYTSGSAADPAWQLAVTELKSYNSLDPYPDHINYSDFKVLKDLISDCEIRRIKQEVRNETLNKTLDILGVSFQDYFKAEDKRKNDNSSS